MFCKKCGAQLNDNAKFCAVCGAQFGNEPVAPVTPVQPVADPFGQQAADPFGQPAPMAQPMMAQPMMAQPAADPYAAPAQGAQNWGPTMQPKKSGKGARIAIISTISALVAVVILVVVLLFACGGSGAASIDEALDMYFEALTDKDLDGVEDIMYPSIFSEVYDEEIFEEEEFVENLIDDANPGDGKPKFGNIKIEEKNKMSAEVIAKANTNLEDYDDYIKIESGVDIRGTIAIKVDGENHTYRLKASLVKADGDWYITSISVGSTPLDSDED